MCPHHRKEFNFPTVSHIFHKFYLVSSFIFLHSFSHNFLHSFSFALCFGPFSSGCVSLWWTGSCRHSSDTCWALEVLSQISRHHVLGLEYTETKSSPLSSFPSSPPPLLSLLFPSPSFPPLLPLLSRWIAENSLVQTDLPQKPVQVWQTPETNSFMIWIWLTGL